MLPTVIKNRSTSVPQVGEASSGAKAVGGGRATPVAPSPRRWAALRYPPSSALWSPTGAGRGPAPCAPAPSPVPPPTTESRGPRRRSTGRCDSLESRPRSDGPVRWVSGAVPQVVEAEGDPGPARLLASVTHPHIVPDRPEGRREGQACSCTSWMTSENPPMTGLSRLGKLRGLPHGRHGLDGGSGADAAAAMTGPEPVSSSRRRRTCRGGCSPPKCAQPAGVWPACQAALAWAARVSAVWACPVWAWAARARR
jgi:hypothetical protein